MWQYDATGCVEKDKETERECEGVREGRKEGEKGRGSEAEEESLRGIAQRQQKEQKVWQWNVGGNSDEACLYASMYACDKKIFNYN